MKKIIILFLLLKSLYIHSKDSQISFWNFTYNPVYGIDTESLAYCSFENKYWINEWNNKTAGVLVKAEENTMQFQFEQRGNLKFSQNQIIGSYSKILSPKLKMGMGLQFFFIQQAEIRQINGLLKPFFGFSHKFNNQNTFFCSISNYKFNPNRSEVPDQINGQWLHHFSKKLKGAITIETGIYNSFITRISSTFDPYHELSFFLEVNSTESPIQFTSNWMCKNWKIRLFSGFHQKLGLSNQLGLAYSW